MVSQRHKKEVPRRGPSPVRASRKPRSFLLALPYVVAVGLLWAVNLALPSFDPSLHIPFTQDIQMDGIAYREINRKYMEPFFPAGSPMIPELKNSLLRPVKAPNALRVLCLGESSMFGVPFAFAATIPSLVRKQLRHLYPDLDVEVINLGASAINTNVIREMVPQYLSLEPDLVLVYTGHNEFYGPEGIGASWVERQVPALTPWKYRLRRLPLVSWLQRWIGGFSSRQSDGEGNLMRQVSGGAQVALESPEALRIFDQFRRNLRDIVHGIREQGIPVIVGEISSNLMFPPFAPRPAMNSDQLPSAVTSGQYAAAESLLIGGLSADSASAYYLYWRGRLCLVQDDSRGAVQFLVRARDHDLLKFRAPGRINEIIHQIGDEESVPVLPIDSLLRARSPRGITDSTFFSEHLHPTFLGYDQIARMYVNAIVDWHLVRPSRPAASLLPFHPDSLSVPWLDLGFGALALRTLTSRWPFTEMPRRRDVLDRCADWELNLARNVYTRKLGWTEACLQYAKDSKLHGKPWGTVTALAALVEEYPERYFLRYGLAAALEAVGRKSDAIAQYRRGIALRPGLAQPAVDFASLLIDEGQYDEAERLLQGLLAAPASEGASTEFRATALYGLAVIEANRDSIPSALQLVEESLRLAPGYQAALSLKSQILSNARR